MYVAPIYVIMLSPLAHALRLFHTNVTCGMTGQLDAHNPLIVA